MKNVKMHENFKKLIGGFKLVFAGAGLGATLLMTGCSGCAVEKEPASEVVVETSETPSQIEIIETSEQPSEEISEEISEEPVVEEAELPELPILDENGNAYVPGMFSTEDVYAAIDRMVAENDFENDLERDKAIAMIIYINSPYISKDTFVAVKDDYLGNIYESDINQFCWDYIGKGTSKVPVNYLFLDEKQGDAALQIVNYCNSDNYSREEYDEYALDFVVLSKEKGGYNPINLVLNSLDKSRSLKKSFDDIDELIYLCYGYKEVAIDNIGNYRIEKTFGDGKTYQFDTTVRGNYNSYHSSHTEKSSGK